MSDDGLYWLADQSLWVSAGVGSCHVVVDSAGPRTTESAARGGGSRISISSSNLELSDVHQLQLEKRDLYVNRNFGPAWITSAPIQVE